MHSGVYVPFDEITKKLPISKGDMVYVISDVLDIAKSCREHKEKFDCEEFIESLKAAVGESGTLLFPTYNWDFCKGIPFNYNTTKGKTGTLGNVALNMPGFKRTQHPLYSFAVWGHDQNVLVEMNNITSFGEDSPFAYMFHKDAYMLVVGNPKARGYTFIHYVEQKYTAAFRYEKEFTADYIDEHENSDTRTYSMYVRDLDIDPKIKDNQFVELDAWMAENRAIIRTYVNNIPYDKINLRQMYGLIKEDLLKNDFRRVYIFGNEELLEAAKKEGSR